VERRYAIFAVGFEKAPSLSFFANANSPIDNTSTDFTCSPTLLCDNTDEASFRGPAREHETENEDRNDDNIQNEVPDYYQENKQQMENFCSTLIIRFWWEFGLSSASKNHLTTSCKPSILYA